MFGTSSARTANFDNQGNLIFDRGKVDFSPQRVVVPGPGGFSPQTAPPGSVGDADYSPLVRVLNAGGVIYNARNIQKSALTENTGRCRPLLKMHNRF